MYWIDNQTDRSLIQAISLVPRPQQGAGIKILQRSRPTFSALLSMASGHLDAATSIVHDNQLLSDSEPNWQTTRCTALFTLADQATDAFDAGLLEGFGLCATLLCKTGHVGLFHFVFLCVFRKAVVIFACRRLQLTGERPQSQDAASG
jgi:hypothetical protein